MHSQNHDRQITNGLPNKWKQVAGKLPVVLASRLVPGGKCITQTRAAVSHFVMKMGTADFSKCGQSYPPQNS
jgi:hypothetical protein